MSMVVKPTGGVNKGLLTELFNVFKSSSHGAWFTNMRNHKKLVNNVHQNIKSLDTAIITPETITNKIDNIREKAQLKAHELGDKQKESNSKKANLLLDSIKNNIISPHGTLMETDPKYLIMAESILGGLADMNIKWSDMIEDMEYKGIKEREYPIALLSFLSKATNRDEYGNQTGLSLEDQQNFPLLSNILNQEQLKPPNPTNAATPKPKPRP